MKPDRGARPGGSVARRAASERCFCHGGTGWALQYNRKAGAIVNRDQP